MKTFNTNIQLSLITKVVLGIIAVIVAYLIVRFFMNTYESFETEESTSTKIITTTVNLYSMVGCGHCVKFKPEWEKLTTTHPNGSTLEDGSIVAYNHYSTDNPADLEKINEDKITGFPTITIQKTGDKTTQYSGPRTMEGIWNFLNIKSEKTA